jgi:Sec-independent protein secretion pathway component TatC
MPAHEPFADTRMSLGDHIEELRQRLGAVFSMTPDYYSMLALTVPLWGLYEVGILLCRWSPRPRIETKESELELRI